MPLAMVFAHKSGLILFLEAFMFLDVLWGGFEVKRSVSVQTPESSLAYAAVQWVKSGMQLHEPKKQGKGMRFGQVLFCTGLPEKGNNDRRSFSMCQSRTLC